MMTAPFLSVIVPVKDKALAINSFIRRVSAVISRLDDPAPQGFLRIMFAIQSLRTSLADRQFVGRWTFAEAGRSWLSVVSYFLLTLLVGRIVWLGTLNEDSFISYRCLENLMHGLGMTWHVDLRSQPYTHPLWMLLHIPLRILIPDVKIVSYMISFACLGGVLWCLHRNYSVWKPIYSLLVLTPLLLSKSFTEYSTSGLENPLAHLVAVIFFTGFLVLLR